MNGTITVDGSLPQTYIF